AGTRIDFDRTTDARDVLAPGTAMRTNGRTGRNNNFVADRDVVDGIAQAAYPNRIAVLFNRRIGFNVPYCISGIPAKTDPMGAAWDPAVNHDLRRRTLTDIDAPRPRRDVQIGRSGYV